MLLLKSHLPSPSVQERLKLSFLENVHIDLEGFSLNHRARVKSTISNFANFLIEEKGLLQRNPTRSIKLLPMPQPVPQPLSGAQRSLLRFIGQTSR